MQRIRASWLAPGAVALALALALLALGACGDGGAGGTAPPAARPGEPAVAGGEAAPPLRLTQVATLDEPLALAVRRDDPALYVVEKGGRVRALRGGEVDPTPVLDLSGQAPMRGCSPQAGKPAH